MGHLAEQGLVSGRLPVLASSTGVFGPSLTVKAWSVRDRKPKALPLRAKLRQGDKSLVGNSAYRRYLTTPDEQHFTIDEARIAEDKPDNFAS
jgi:hypothetical protein